MNSRKQKLIEKLNPKFLKMTPKLSGVTGGVIDLDEGGSSLEDGAKKLMMRFLKNQDLNEKLKRNSEENTEVTVSSARYNENEEICGLVSEKLIFPLGNYEDTEFFTGKPGGKLQKLKMALQDKISAKWEEEYKKRVNQVKNQSDRENDKTKKDYEESSCTSEEEDSEDNDIKSKSSKNSKKSCNEDENGSDISDGDVAHVQSGFNSNNEDDSNDDIPEILNCHDKKWDARTGNQDEKKNSMDASTGTDNCDQYDECSLVPPYQPGGGLLYGGSNLTQSEEDLPQNLLSPLSFNVSESSCSKSFSESLSKVKDAEETTNSFTEQKKLFSNSQNVNECFDLNDAFEFCSGKFPDSQEQGNFVTNEENIKKGINGKSELTEHDPKKNNVDSNNTNVNLFSGSFDTKKRIIIMDDSDSEDENNDDNSIQENNFHNPIIFLNSDDDDDGGGGDIGVIKKKHLKMSFKRIRKNLEFSDEEHSNSESDDNNDVQKEALSSDEVDDDDQRSVHYDSEENEILNLKEYFEREAELSGDECSEDEDERGLDEFDREEGDADELDNGEVRSQLEKIHIRRLLDDDAREVRLIQEILFEDGDLHSDGKRRDRKFKWKNLGTFDDTPNENECDENLGNTSEEDCAEEDERRKIRHERELFLMENKNKNSEGNSDEEIIEDNFQHCRFTNLKSSFRTSVPNKNGPLIGLVNNFDNNTSSAVHVHRGSFLTRNEEFLSRLAKATSGITENVLGPKHSKNFVFAAKSPEKINDNGALKRQIVDVKGDERPEKKRKLFPCELMNSRPSIVDLLI